MNSINTVKRYFCIALFLLSSLWAAIIISLESGTSVMKYDAYNAGNTNWSDETSYYITIRCKLQDKNDQKVENKNVHLFHYSSVPEPSK